MGLSQGKHGLVKVVDLRGHVVVHHHDLVGVHDFIGVQASQAHHPLEGVGQDLMVAGHQRLGLGGLVRPGEDVADGRLMPIDDGVVIAEKVGGQRPIRALDAHVIEQIAVLAGGEGTVGKGDPDLFPLAVLLEMIFQGQEMGGRGVGVPDLFVAAAQSRADVGVEHAAEGLGRFLSLPGPQASAHIVSLDMGLDAEDGGDDPGDDGQTDHDPHDGSHPIRGGRPLGVGRASGQNHGSHPFILAYLRKAGRYRRTACIPFGERQKLPIHRIQPERRPRFCAG